MFTGIVEQVGVVAAVVEQDNGRRLHLSVAAMDAVAQGGSIAVNGVCLTAVDGEGGITVDVIPETLSRSNLGRLEVGDRVNIERAMPADGRFDGHIVQGHVDGTGTIEAIDVGGDGVIMTVEAPEDLLVYVVEKGSITVDGVSLTVAAVTESGFRVALIPHTLEVTTLGLRKRGEPVNLEVDVLAKYVERLLKAHR